VRLACLIHAANVRSEPGSNPSKVLAYADSSRCRVVSLPSLLKAGSASKNQLKPEEFEVALRHDSKKSLKDDGLHRRCEGCVTPQGVTHLALACRCYRIVKEHSQVTARRKPGRASQPFRNRAFLAVLNVAALAAR